MPAATATHSRRKSTRKGRFRSAREMEKVIGRALDAVNEDEGAGSLLRATGMRLRIESPDLRVVVSIAASEEPDRYLDWSFSGAPWTPKLELRMDSAVANSILQGEESLPIAIARGRVKCSCDARAALRYLPAARLIQERYRKLVHDEYPHLAIA